jgi:GNAT superfamily N-acetyltransferase
VTVWRIRRATEDDAAALVALCHAAVGLDDYVPSFVDDFLETGVIFVAEESAAPIGMMVYHDLPDGSAWLHAARTHPDWRQRGVATALMASCERLARERGRTAIRLWAEAANVASVTANRKVGFVERARFTRMRIPAGRAEGAPILTRMSWDARSRSGVQKSPLLRRAAGYVFHDFYFLRLDRANGERLAREGALWRFGRNGVSVSEDYEEAWGKDLQIQPLFGDLDEILRACPAIAAARGADRVESFLPHDAAFLDAARHAGFDSMEWGQEAILFEKTPAPSLPSRRRRRPQRPG